MKANESENKIVQNLWDEAKMVLRGKYRIQAYLQKQNSQIHNLTLYRKELEK